jgi:hypothetical protein
MITQFPLCLRKVEATLVLRRQTRVMPLLADAQPRTGHQGGIGMKFYFLTCVVMAGQPRGKTTGIAPPPMWIPSI